VASVAKSPTNAGVTLAHVRRLVKFKVNTQSGESQIEHSAVLGRSTSDSGCAENLNQAVEKCAASAFARSLL
jgi:hypothetical protein